MREDGLELRVVQPRRDALRPQEDRAKEAEDSGLDGDGKRLQRNAALEAGHTSDALKGVGLASVSEGGRVADDGSDLPPAPRPSGEDEQDSREPDGCECCGKKRTAESGAKAGCSRKDGCGRRSGKS